MIFKHAHMKRLFLLGVILVCACTGFTQTVTIRDEVSFQPLELVTLHAPDLTLFATSNALGEVDISAFKHLDTVVVHTLGYETRYLSYEQLRQADPALYLRPSTISLDQFVISATRWKQPNKVVPQRVTTISAKDVILQNPQTAADLLGTSGEVFIQKSQQGGGSPMIRGFSTNRLLLSVDGVRMNTAIFRSGNLQNVISLDPFALEQTEVLFGPGSVMYGSDAIGGVLSFHTLTPKLGNGSKPKVSGSATARYASANNERTGHFHINLGWKRWALVTSFTQTDFDDLRMGRNGPDEYLRTEYVERIDTVDVVVANDDPLIQRPTAYSQTNLMQKVRFKPNEKWDVTYGFHYSTTTDYSRYDRHIRYRNGEPRSARWDYGPQVWMMNNLSIEHHGSTPFYDELQLRIAHQWFEESRIDRDFNDPEERTRLETVHAYSFNLDLEKEITLNQKLFYGIEGVYDDILSEGTVRDIETGVAQPGAPRYPTASWASYAAFATYVWTISKRWTWQLGARYNQFATRATFSPDFFNFPVEEADLNYGSPSGSTGLLFRPTDRWEVSVQASTGFRAPNIDDIGKVFDSEPGAVVVPNPNLEAEYAYNAEVNVAKLFGSWLKIDAAAYYTWLEDALVRRDFTLNGQDSIVYDGELSQVQAIQNAANAYVWGVQAGIEMKLPAGFGLSSRFNYQQGEEELDDGSTSPSRHVAPWFGATHVTYSMQGLLLDFYAVYNGEISYDDLAVGEQEKDFLYARDGNGNPYSPGWYTLNFKALYQLNTHFSISAGVENLTDQRYRPYSSGIAAAGRNVVLAMKANF